MKQVWAILGKSPIADFAKTRLAKDLGKEQALQAYRYFLEDFFEGLSQHSLNIPIFFFGTPTNEQTRNYFQNLFNQIRLNIHFNFQDDQLSFFPRLKSMFEVIEGQFQEEVFIHLTGTDIPDFPFHFLTETKTEAADIGPDFDGGFYYLGVNSRFKDILLLDVSDGQSSVYSSLIRRCEQFGLSINTLPEWGDIDTLADYRRFIQRFEAGGNKRQGLQTYQFFRKIITQANKGTN